MDYKDKPKIRGRMMPPPSVGRWETLATNLDEFQSVAVQQIFVAIYVHVHSYICMYAYIYIHGDTYVSMHHVH